MKLEEFNIIIFITGIILGSIVTLIVKSVVSKNNIKQSPSNSVISVKSLQQELDKRQIIIDNFFSDANEQLIGTEKRMLELRNNLMAGATKLSNVNIVNPLMNTEEQEVDITTFEPPRDYALKTDDDQGTLSEKFGFNDSSDSLEPKRTI